MGRKLPQAGFSISAVATLPRQLGRHARVKQPLENLTHLFQRARFSSEPIDEEMRASAIEALTEIRDYYTAISWKRISNRRTGRAKSGTES